jgi:hypothetical protein
MSEAAMDTYTLVSGTALDLSGLTTEERDFLSRCHAAYRAGMDWSDFALLAEGSSNPLVRNSGGWITPAVQAHPLYRAVRDLEDRLGILQHELEPEADDDVSREPFAAQREEPAAMSAAGSGAAR